MAHDILFFTSFLEYNFCLAQAIISFNYGLPIQNMLLPNKG